MKQPDVWVLAVDDHEARLLHGRTLRSRHHLDLVDTLENRWRTDALEHEVPRSELECRNSERLRRYAKEVAGWLEVEVARHGFGAVDVFAAPRVLGALRRALCPTLSARIDLHHGGLGFMSTGDMEHHPPIAALFECG